MPPHPAIMPANTAALAGDAYRYAPAHPLLSHGGAIGGVNFPGGAVMATNNPLLQSILQKALNEVRSADKATRLYYQIECTAKQLALQITEYEEMLNNQEQPGPGPGQQGMGDDGGA